MSEANENAAPQTDRTPFIPWSALARPAEMLLGLVFLVSALLKAADINSFIVAIGLYGVVSGDVIQTVVALVTLAVESALGIALLLGWRPRILTQSGAILLLLAFSGLILYGWLANGITDCGCSGPIKMGPKVSLLKNAALLTLVLTAVLGFRKKAATGSAFVPKTVAALVCAAAVTGYSYSQIEPPAPPSPPETGPYAQFVFDADGQKIDLGKGEHFVALLSSTCEHCMASVEKLNRLVELDAFPPLVGLCEGTPEAYEEFVRTTGPQFPTHLIPMRAFFSLIGQAPPRFALVRNGKAVQTWDSEVPDPGLVKQVVQNAKSVAP